jgi:broad specificity phosphatase PhoE
MKRIYFVRHGVTSFTEEPERFCGVSDPPLSNHGHAQISSLADALEGIVNPSLVLHSPLRRAVQTASILAEQLDCSHLGCDDLREVAFGDWEGLSRDDIVARSGPEFSKWQANCFENPPPCGEPSDSIIARIHRLRDALTSASETSVLIVVHKAFSRMAFGTWLGVSPPYLRTFIDLKPGELGLIGLSPVKAQLRLLNWRPASLL